MHGAEYTGVTLQTLDHRSFDCGTILAQTPPPGIKIELEKRPTFVDLLNLITPVGADMLTTGIRDRIFVPPFPKLAVSAPPTKLIHAPKINSEDKEPDWSEWDTAVIARRYRALGPLWNTIVREDGTRLRIKLDGIEEVEPPWISRPVTNKAKSSASLDTVAKPNMEAVPYSYAGGQTLPLLYVKHGNDVIIPAGRDGMAVKVSHITIEGQSRKPARLALENLRGGVR